VRLTTSPPSCAECHGIWEPKSPGTLWATPDLLCDSFTFNFTNILYQMNNLPTAKEKIHTLDMHN